LLLVPNLAGFISSVVIIVALAFLIYEVRGSKMAAHHWEPE
jgi:hypothetical protein